MATSLGSALVLPSSLPRLSEHQGEESFYAAEIIRLVLNWAHGQTKRFHPSGLAHLTLSDEQWQAIPANILTPPTPAVPAIPAHGDQQETPAVPAVPGVYAPRPTEIPPPRPAATASKAIWTVYELDVQLANDIGIINATFKQNFEEIVGPHVLRDISDPTFGTSQMAPHELFQAFCTKYGVPTATDITKLEAQLANPLTGLLGPHLVNHAHTHARLSNCGQPLSEATKLRIFSESVCGHPSILAAIHDFKTKFPALSQQTFVALKAHLDEQTPNLSVSAAQHGYGTVVAQHTKVTAAGAVDPDITTQLLATIATLQAQLAAGSKRPTSASRSYCFRHGYCDHRGTACRVMAADGTYTAEHKAATAPNQVYLNGSGGSTHGVPGKAPAKSHQK